MKRLVRVRVLLGLAVVAAILGGFFAWRSLTGPGAPSGYFVSFPREPGPLDSEGRHHLQIKTNLPEGTISLAQIDDFYQDSTECCPAVRDGAIDLQIANNDCTMAGDTYRGSSGTIQITVAPTIELILHGCHPCDPTRSQPRAVLDALGPHFERLVGEQVSNSGGDRIIKVTGHYRLPPETCTDVLVAGENGLQQSPLP